ncbi:hypothetical protein MO973_01300 [Paenibacillus sp. TRM 82003]|nr:hypothetical protein [Paenibacillus sp. TRM 82003]
MLLVYAIALLLGGLFTINAVFAYQGKHIDPSFWTTFWYQAKLSPFLFIALLMVGYGVKFSYRVFGSMTFALTFSKGLEILVCVCIGYTYLKETPNWKTLLGLAVVIVGFWISKLK